MIKGKLYCPYDNSWCINVETGTEAALKTIGFPFGNISSCKYEIVSEPYEVLISEYNTTRQFINVKSSNTGIVYRTLFCEGNVLN